MRLTDEQVDKLQPEEETLIINCGKNLYMYVYPHGVKSWQYKYLKHKRTYYMTIGHYPEINCQAAWREAQKLKVKLVKGELSGGKRNKTYASKNREWVKKITKKIEKLVLKEGITEYKVNVAFYKDINI